MWFQVATLISRGQKQAYDGASCGGKWAEAWKDWAKAAEGMVNAAEEAMKEPVPNFVRGESMDDKGMIFMHLEFAAIAVAGVRMLDHELDDGLPSRSEH